MSRPISPIQRLLPAVAVTCAALAAVTVAAAPANAAPTTGTITGVVTAGGRPLQGVTVEAGVAVFVGFNHQFEVDAATRTRADGSYTLTGVPVGSEERVQFVAAGAVGGTSATGYADRCYGGSGNCAFTGREFTVRAGGTIAGVDVTLAKAAVIRGRLTDTLGRGVGHLQVLLYHSSNPDQADDGEFASYATTSDANGNYAFPGLYTNTWGLCVSTPQAPLSGTPHRDGYVGGCQAVAVSPGQVRTLSKVLTAGGGVSGTVVDQTGQPVGGATVSGSRFQFNPATTSRPDGIFRLGRVLPGAEELCVSAPRFTPRCDVAATITSFGTTQVGRIVLHRES